MIKFHEIDEDAYDKICILIFFEWSGIIDKCQKLN